MQAAPRPPPAPAPEIPATWPPTDAQLAPERRPLRGANAVPTPEPAARGPDPNRAGLELAIASARRAFGFDPDG